MWPNRVSNPGPLAVESDALSTAPRGTANEWQHRRMAQNKSWRKARMSSFTHSLQHFFSKGLCLMLWKNMTERLAEALEALIERLDKNFTRDKMEICHEKTKLMTTSVSDIQGEIKVKGQKL